ncbi:MAG: response regulator [Mucilaginibacter sp.]
MKCINVLLVEDNEGDVFLTTEGLAESGICNKLASIKDGQKAISFFESLKVRDGVPHIVILDINLPKMNGHEVLRYIKKHEIYKSIPVIMFTTSSAAKDMISCYANQANCYIVKPTEAADYIEVVGKIVDFWSNVVTLPAFDSYRAPAN